MFTIPTHEPHAFVAGDTVQWSKTLPDFSPADGWSLHYRLVGDASEIAAASIVATDNGIGGWDVVIPATATLLAAGTYRLIGWVENTATPVERHTAIDYVLTVEANLALGDPSTLQSANVKILAAIDARLSNRLVADQESVSINGTMITRIPIEKLMTMRGVYAAKVWREQHPGVSNPRHAMRFGHVR